MALRCWPNKFMYSKIYKKIYRFHGNNMAAQYNNVQITHGVPLLNLVSFRKYELFMNNNEKFITGE